MQLSRLAGAYSQVHPSFTRPSQMSMGIFATMHYIIWNFNYKNSYFWAILLTELLTMHNYCSMFLILFNQTNHIDCVLKWSMVFFSPQRRILPPTPLICVWNRYTSPQLVWTFSLRLFAQTWTEVTAFPQNIMHKDLCSITKSWDNVQFF